VDSHAAGSGSDFELLKKALQTDDAALARAALSRSPDLKSKVNEPWGPFDTPPVVNVRSREMLDVLLEYGADINAKSRWWAGGFGVLDWASPELAKYAIERGAVVSAHAAARFSMMDRLRALVAEDPSLVHARGGDGQTPLHFAGSTEVASYLLDHGADIDARDIDHESTPAQYMLGERNPVAEYLVGRGCRTDLLMAAALGNLDLAKKHLDADPDCIRLQVSDECFPKVNPESGGTIYNWTLGFYATPHGVAKRFGHDALVSYLFERSPEPVRRIAACWLGDETMVDALLAATPKIDVGFTDADRRQLAHAARNNETDAVRLMLRCGLPVDAAGQHQATSLHWAAFHGNAQLVRTILLHMPPLEAKDADYNATPLGWAIHGSENGWRRDQGDYAATVEALIEAGAQVPAVARGTEAVKEVLRRHGARDEAK
jgi:ankyrin repeat protein